MIKLIQTFVVWTNSFDANSEFTQNQWKILLWLNTDSDTGFLDKLYYNFPISTDTTDYTKSVT